MSTYEIDFDAADDIADGTYLLGVLELKEITKKDADTGEPTGAKSFAVECEVIAGTNSEMVGRTHTEFLSLPSAKDDAKQKNFKIRKLADWAKALKLVDPNEAKGKKAIDWDKASGVQFCGSIKKKGNFVNLDVVVRDDDPSVAHIVAAHHGNKPNGKLVGAAAGPSIDI